MAATHPVVHLVDDEAPMRDALAWLFQSHDIGSTQHASAEAFLAHIADGALEAPTVPGCILLDMRLEGGMTGSALFDRLRADGMCEVWPVIFLTGHGDIAMAVEALKRGAFDFVEKPFNDESFIARIEAALAESGRRLQRAGEIASFDQRIATLTPREREVMDLVVDGHYNKVIADRLGIVPRTVEFFRARVFEKMGVRSAVELASQLASHERTKGP